jgi:hypothetical protein
MVQKSVYLAHDGVADWTHLLHCPLSAVESCHCCILERLFLPNKRPGPGKRYSTNNQAADIMVCLRTAFALLRTDTPAT